MADQDKKFSAVAEFSKENVQRTVTGEEEGVDGEIDEMDEGEESSVAEKTAKLSSLPTNRDMSGKDSKDSRKQSNSDRRRHHRHHHSSHRERRRRMAGTGDFDGEQYTSDEDRYLRGRPNFKRRLETVGDTFSDITAPARQSYKKQDKGHANHLHGYQQRSRQNGEEVSDSSELFESEDPLSQRYTSAPKRITKGKKDQVRSPVLGEGDAEDGEILEDGELNDDELMEGKVGEDVGKDSTEVLPSKLSSKEGTKGEKNSRKKSDHKDRRKRECDAKIKRKKLTNVDKLGDESNQTPAWGSGYQGPKPKAYNSRHSQFGRGYSPPGLYDSPSYSEESEEETATKILMTEGYIDASVAADEKEGIFNPKVTLGKKKKLSLEKNDRKRGRNVGGKYDGPPRKKPLVDLAMSDRPACRFYLEGKCAKGSGCQFNHDVEKPRKMEVCKYHLTVKGCIKQRCIYMHDFPCKYYHTGAKCYSGDRCKFSHDALTEETRRALEMRVAAADIVDMEDPDYEYDYRPRESQSRPSLLGSPPRHRQDMKKIPSLFEIEVHPPGQSPSPSHQVVSRPSGFYSEPSNSPKPGVGLAGSSPNMGMINNSGTMNQQGLSNQGNMGGPGLLQTPLRPGNIMGGPMGNNRPSMMMNIQQGLNTQQQRPGGVAPIQFLGPGNMNNNQQGGNLPPVLNMLGAIIREAAMQKGSGASNSNINVGPNGGVGPSNMLQNMRNLGPAITIGGPNNMQQGNMGMVPNGMAQNGMGNIMLPNNMGNMQQNNTNNMGNMQQNNANNMGNMQQNNANNMGNMQQNNANNMGNMQQNNANNMGNMQLNNTNNMGNMQQNNANNMGNMQQNNANNMGNMQPNNMGNMQPNNANNMGPLQNMMGLSNIMANIGPNMGPNDNLGPVSAISNAMGINNNIGIGQEVGIMDVDYRIKPEFVMEEANKDISELDKIRQQIQAQIDEEDEEEEQEETDGIMKDSDEDCQMQIKEEELSPAQADSLHEKEDLRDDKTLVKAEVPADVEHLEIPANLPKKQRELFKRIQQQQLLREKERKRQEALKAAEEAEAKADDDDWYSSDEDGESDKKPKLEDVLKNLNQKPTAESSGMSPSTSGIFSSNSSGSSTASTLNIIQMINAIKSQTTSKPLTESVETSSSKFSSTMNQQKSILSSPASPPPPASMTLKNMSSISSLQLPELTVEPLAVNAHPVKPLVYSVVKISLDIPKPYTQLPDNINASDSAFKDDPRIKWHLQHLEKQMQKEAQRRDSSDGEKPQKKTDPRLKKGLSDPRLAKTGDSPDNRPSDPRLQRAQAQPRPADPRLARQVGGSLDPRLGRQNSQNNSESLYPSGPLNSMGSGLMNSMGGVMSNQMGGVMNQLGDSMNQFSGSLNSNQVGGLVHNVGLMNNMSGPVNNQLAGLGRPLQGGAGPVGNNMSMMGGPMNNIVGHINQNVGPFNQMIRMGGSQGPGSNMVGLEKVNMMGGYMGNMIRGPTNQQNPVGNDLTIIDPRMNSSSVPRPGGQRLCNDPRGASDPRLKNRLMDPREQRMYTVEPHSGNVNTQDDDGLKDSRVCDGGSNNYKSLQGISRGHDDLREGPNYCQDEAPFLSNPGQFNMSRVREEGASHSHHRTESSGSPQQSSSKLSPPTQYSDTDDKPPRKFDYRNDPRFKRVKRLAGTPRSRMEYSSPLSSEGGQRDFDDGEDPNYNGYSHHKISARDPRNRNAPSPSLPDTLQDFDLPNSSAVTVQEPEIDLKVKDLFKTIDPTASPFC